MPEDEPLLSMEEVFSIVAKEQKAAMRVLIRSLNHKLRTSDFKVVNENLIEVKLKHPPSYTIALNNKLKAKGWSMVSFKRISTTDYTWTIGRKD